MVGFSALCVLTWGLAMHYVVDGNEGLPEDAAASTSLEHPVVVEDKCWKGYPTSPYIWILAGPMTTALLVSGHPSMTSQSSDLIRHTLSLFMTQVKYYDIVN